MWIVIIKNKNKIIGIRLGMKKNKAWQYNTNSDFIKFFYSIVFFIYFMPPLKIKHYAGLSCV